MTRRVVDDQTVYDQGYDRGRINAPRSEVEETGYYAWLRYTWLQGYDDGHADWTPGDPGFVDP